MEVNNWGKFVRVLNFCRNRLMCYEMDKGTYPKELAPLEKRSSEPDRTAIT